MDRSIRHTFSRLIDRLKTEFHFKFAAFALQFNLKMQLFLFEVSFLFGISLEMHFINPQEGFLISS